MYRPLRAVSGLKAATYFEYLTSTAQNNIMSIKKVPTFSHSFMLHWPAKANNI